MTRERKLINVIYSLFFIVLLLLFTNIFFIYKYYLLKEESKKHINRLNITLEEKQKLQEELNKLLVEYDQLKTTNDTIKRRLDEEKNKIKELIEKIRKTKIMTNHQINMYKKEIELLRSIMKSYIKQIDSLNTRNRILTEENRRIKSEFQKVITEKQELIQKTQDLTKKIESAAKLKVSNISVIGLTSKEKETQKAKKIDKLKVCFTINENKLVSAGERWVYIIIKKENNQILNNVDNEVLVIKNDTIYYSAKREVDYQNSDLDVCIYWKNINNTLAPGNYTLEVLIDEKIVGTDRFILK